MSGNAINIQININAQQAAAGLQQINQQGQLLVQQFNAAGSTVTNFFGGLNQGTQGATGGLTGLNQLLRFAGFAGVIGLVHSGFHTLTDFIGDAVKEATKLEAALAGLSAVAAFKGLGETEAQDAVKNLFAVKAGLISVGEASTAMKNLLQSGFNLRQTIDIIDRMSDSASFARQGSLTFGRAVVSATEGIRNQNSILSDNAGLTKNLSVILKERGFRLADLADKVKGVAAREALYQGILVETAAQQGDAAKYSELYAGQVAKLDSAYVRLQQTLGGYITQSEGIAAILGVTTDAVNDLNRALGRTPSDSPIFDFANRQLLSVAGGVSALKLLLRGSDVDTEGYLADLKSLDDTMRKLGMEEGGLGRGKAVTLKVFAKQVGAAGLYKQGAEIAASIEQAFQVITEKPIEATFTVVAGVKVVEKDDDLGRMREFRKKIEELDKEAKQLDDRAARDAAKSRSTYNQALFADDPLALIAEKARAEREEIKRANTDASGRFRLSDPVKQQLADSEARERLEAGRALTKIGETARSTLDGLLSAYNTQTGNPFVAIAVSGESAMAKLRLEMARVPDDMQAIYEQAILVQQGLTGLSLAQAGGDILRKISDAGAELMALTSPETRATLVFPENGGQQYYEMATTYFRETEGEKLTRLFNDAPAAEAIYRAAFAQSGLSPELATREARKLANQGLIGEARGFDINAFNPSQRAQYAQELVEYRAGQADMLARAIATEAKIALIADALTTGGIGTAAGAVSKFMAVVPTDPGPMQAFFAGIFGAIPGAAEAAKFVVEFFNVPPGTRIGATQDDDRAPGQTGPAAGSGGMLSSQHVNVMALSNPSGFGE